jgi:hypothetical protein
VEKEGMRIALTLLIAGAVSSAIAIAAAFAQSDPMTADGFEPIAIGAAA